VRCRPRLGPLVCCERASQRANDDDDEDGERTHKAVAESEDVLRGRKGDASGLLLALVVLGVSREEALLDLVDNLRA